MLGLLEFDPYRNYSSSLHHRIVDQESESREWEFIHLHYFFDQTTWELEAMIIKIMPLLVTKLAAIAY